MVIKTQSQMLLHYHRVHHKYGRLVCMCTLSKTENGRKMCAHVRSINKPVCHISCSSSNEHQWSPRYSMLVKDSYICIGYVDFLMLWKTFSICSIKEANEDASIYTTENRRIPQNLMGVGNVRWFSIQERTVAFTVHPALQGKVIRNICLSLKFGNKLSLFNTQTY